MARGQNSPAVSSPLPKVSFSIVQDGTSTRPAGTHDLQARSYGYNDFSDFQKPEHYIRYIEPLESELAVQVEYDMDEQDQEWLDAVNAERKKEQLNTVSYETFEVIMDRLEKEWFDLTKNIPKPDFALPSEDSTCAICDDSEGENSNAIVFCDGCNLAVHQDCYGVPYIPEGQWLCRKCTVSPENPVSCLLCPNEGGAFKQTVLGDWAHLLCAIWIPETRVANDVFMEPITGIEKISKQRWKLKCSICGVREGSCIQCSRTSCFLAFHATCARREKLLMPMKSTHGTEAVPLTCYCEKHLPKEQQDARLAALAADGADVGGSTDKLSKSARAYAKTYKTGPPLVPAIIVDRITQYWSLKREARRGAPLLKRLHLEPWTASNINKQQTEEEKATKLEYLRRLRKDLDSVRELVLQTRKRESRKLAQAESIHKVVGLALLPHSPPLRLVFERILALDRQELFKNPVSKAEVPDYYDIIQHPMCWKTIDSKLDQHEYWDVQEFKNDIQLVVANAMLYNKPGTAFYKVAQRIQTSSQAILAEIDHLPVSHRTFMPREVVVNPFSDLEHTNASLIGDLEPPLEVLDLITSIDEIKNQVPLILDKDPLVSLFDYEIGRLKPLPCPSPPSQPKVKSKRKSRSLKNIDGRALDGSPGFRAPRTRRALAAAAAFEAEAHGGVIPDTEMQTGDGHNEITDDGRLIDTKQSTVKSRRRPPNLPGQSEVPPMVDNVDSQRSFKMFDAGWILPPDQRRGGRAPVERPPTLPPKKRQRIDRGTSHLSTLSRGASENLTVPEAAAVTDTDIAALGRSIGDEIPSEGLAEQEIQVPEISVETQQTELISAVSSHTSAAKVVSERGTVIIEQLDSPLTRKEKAKRRKAEKQKQEESREQAPILESPLAGPSSLPVFDTGNLYEMASALSSLSDLESEDYDAREPLVADADPGEENLQRYGENKALSAKTSRPAKSNATTLTNGQMLEGGTLVWAKADTYPWWPAVIYESDDRDVPKSVVKQKDTSRRRGTGPVQLIRFFDKSSSWQWLDNQRLLLLGEDKALDEEMLASTSRKQRWKTASIRQDCRDAYRKAIAEMETETDVGEQGTITS